MSDASSAAQARLTALLSSSSLSPIYIESRLSSQPALIDFVTSTLDLVSSSSSNSETVRGKLPRHVVLDLHELDSIRKVYERTINVLSGWSERNRVDNWDGTIEVALRRVDSEDASTDDEDEGPPRKRKKDLNGHAASPKRKANGKGKARALTPLDSDEEEPAYDWDWDAPAADGTVAIRSPVHFADSLDSFLDALKGVFKIGAAYDRSQADGSAQEDGDGATRYLVIVGAERIPTLALGASTHQTSAPKETGLSQTLLGALTRLPELTGGRPLKVVFVGAVGWRKAWDMGVGVNDVLLSVYWPPHEKNELLAALSAGFETTNPSISHRQHFLSLVSLLYDTFSSILLPSDTREYAYLAASLWPQWKEVAEGTQTGKKDPKPEDVRNWIAKLMPEQWAKLGELRQALTYKPLEKEEELEEDISEDEVEEAPMGAKAKAAAAKRKKKPAGAAALKGFEGALTDVPATTSSAKEPAKLAGRGMYDDGDSFFNRAGYDEREDALVASTSRSRAAEDRLDAPIPASSGIYATDSTADTGASASNKSKVPAKLSETYLAQSLSKLARLLLVASYCASFNTSKSDVKLFVGMGDGGSPQKGKGGTGGGKKKGSPAKTPTNKKGLTTAEQGPKSFALDRLVAITEALGNSEEITNLQTWEISQRVDILHQINTLVSLRLLDRITPSEKAIEGTSVKLRCGISRELADALADSIGWKKWRQWLQGTEDA